MKDRKNKTKKGVKIIWKEIKDIGILTKVKRQKKILFMQIWLYYIIFENLLYNFYFIIIFL